MALYSVIKNISKHSSKASVPLPSFATLLFEIRVTFCYFQDENVHYVRNLWCSICAAHGGMNKKEWAFLSFPIGASEVTVRGAAAIL
ncbi:hypothetical protein AVEN_119041-1 [Araneus ventricosus]|uniref:Uncharacterized protein n=1 Tax=Araneus ventricosus TaxID=182803 RepID=A0A4Y2FGD3_ARAVE|nr:hypothetical protein AVEN_119041-1 [Araneus ventricosus]